jgi:pimeloyl-[acyl-carrier protein] methyl ester esterase
MTPSLLLLLPGLDGTGEMFDYFLPQVPAGYEAKVVSYPRDRFVSLSGLAKIAAEAAPKDRPVVVVAESFSGPVALELARLGILDIRAFVFAASFALAPFPLLCGLARFLPLAAIVGFPRPRWYARLVATGFDAPDDLVTRMREVNRSVRPKVLSARIRALHGIDYTADLARLSVPCLYLASTRDRTVPRWNLRPFRERVRDLTVVDIDGPHLLLQTRPLPCARAIGEFLKVHNL